MSRSPDPSRAADDAGEGSPEAVAGVRLALAALMATLTLYGLWSSGQLIARAGWSAMGWAVAAAWLALAALILRARTGRAWAGIVVGASALRVGAAWLAAGRVSTGDSQLYLELAHHLLAGRGLVVHEPYMAMDVRGLYPPLYALVLAGWGAIAGLGAAARLILSTLIDVAAAALIVRLGEVLALRRAGIAAAALYLIWPSTLLDAPLAQKEGLVTLLTLALANGWLACLRDRRGWRGAWRVGLPAAALALTQPGLAPLALLFGLAMLPRFGWRAVLRAGVPAATLAGLTMLPWWVRNALAFGRFVPLTTASGLSLWIGSNPEATGGWLPYPAGLRASDEIAYAEAAGRIARGWIVDHPADAVRLYLAKFARAMTLAQGGTARLATMRPPLPAALLLPVTQGAHLILLGGAAIGAWAGPRALLLALVAAGVAQIVVFGLPFELVERHRQFLTPLLLLLAV